MPNKDKKFELTNIFNFFKSFFFKNTKSMQQIDTLVSIKEELQNITYFTEKFGNKLNGYYSKKLLKLTKKDLSRRSHIDDTNEEGKRKIIAEVTQKGRIQLLKDFERGITFLDGNQNIIDRQSLNAKIGSDAHGITADQRARLLEELLHEKIPELTSQLASLYEHFDQNVFYGTAGAFINTFMVNGLIHNTNLENGSILTTQATTHDISKTFFLSEDGHIHLKIKRELGFKSSINGNTTDYFDAIEYVEEEYLLDNEHGFKVIDIKTKGHPLTSSLCDPKIELSADIKLQAQNLIQEIHMAKLKEAGLITDSTRSNQFIITIYSIFNFFKNLFSRNNDTTTIHAKQPEATVIGTSSSSSATIAPCSVTIAPSASSTADISTISSRTSSHATDDDTSSMPPLTPVSTAGSDPRS